MNDTTNYTCAECGMPTHSGDYHPYAACLMFKSSKKSSTVRENLEFVIENGRRDAEQQLTTSRELCEKYKEIAEELAETSHVKEYSLIPRFIKAQAKLEALNQITL